MTRVMIAVDGSEHDRRVAETARQLFGDDTDFWAVNVQPAGNTTPAAITPATSWAAVAPVMYGGAYPYGAADIYSVRSGGDQTHLRDDVDQRARTASADAGLADADVVAEVGDPADAIRRAAVEHGADVVVVGTHDRSWWSKLVSPSVSGDLIDDSPVPVVLVR